MTVTTRRRAGAYGGTEVAVPGGGAPPISAWSDATDPPRRVAGSLTELLGREVSGEVLTGDDGKTGARLERVTVDGHRYMLKYLHLDDDWAMRATGDLAIRAVAVWRDGWLDRLPPDLVPEGDDELPREQHGAFIDHMTELHATFWGTAGTPGLCPLATRLILFGPQLGETECAYGGTDLVPTQLVPEGWSRLTERAPEAAAIITGLLADPTRLLTGLTETPQTFVHGDWKAGNLGSHPDGRTILLDWAIPGIAPGCFDLAWYTCLNRTRLPESKEDTFARYRVALEARGIDTADWWEQQLTLCLLAIMLNFGWEKALGDADELAWWEDRVLAGARWLTS